MKRVLIALVILISVATAVFAIPRRTPSAPPVSEAQASAEANEIAKRLTTLDGYPFDARYSEGAHDQAVRLASLTREAYMYFASVFPGIRPRLIATFLTPADWKRGYGVPSYYPPTNACASPPTITLSGSRLAGSRRWHRRSMHTPS